jgi:hypothetical protein
MTGTKYIVVSNDNVEQMIVFPASINHIDMAKAMKRMRFHNVVSARVHR